MSLYFPILIPSPPHKNTKSRTRQKSSSSTTSAFAIFASGMSRTPSPHLFNNDLTFSPIISAPGTLYIIIINSFWISPTEAPPNLTARDIVHQDPPLFEQEGEAAQRFFLSIVIKHRLE